MSVIKKFTKGSGEFVAFAIVSVLICGIFLYIVSFVQLFIGINAITKAADVAGRAAVLCTSYDDAVDMASMAADSSVTYTSIEDLDTEITFVDDDENWWCGELIVITTSANVHTISPLSSRSVSRSVIVAIENSESSSDTNEGLTGDTTTEQMWNYLTSNGLTDVAAAAIIGNIYQESHYNTASANGSGNYGLVQWGGSRWINLQSFASSRGTSWTDLETQLAFVTEELNGSYAGVLAVINNTDSLYTATWSVYDDYENPGSSDTTFPTRLTEANRIYNLYSD